MNVSESTEQNIGLILGKVEGINATLSDTRDAIEKIDQKVDDNHHSLDKRLDTLESRFSVVQTVWKTLKVLGVFFIGVLTYNWEQIVKLLLLKG